MGVDVYKSFTRFIAARYLQDTYFVDACLNFTSKYSEETDLNNFRLKIYLEENNNITDGCNGKRKYCDMNFLKDIELTDISSKVVKPFNKTYIQNTDINYITHKDVWDIEEF